MSPPLPPQAKPITFVLTADRAISRPFYEDVLGLAVLEENPHAVTFVLSVSATLQLVSLAGYVPQEHSVLGWEVPDIRATVAALRERGVTLRVYEGFGQDADGIWTAPDGATMVGWFTDPEGNVLSLTQS